MQQFKYIKAHARRKQAGAKREQATQIVEQKGSACMGSTEAHSESGALSHDWMVG